MELANTFWIAITAIGLGAALLALAGVSLRVVAAQSPTGHIISPITLPVEATSDSGVLIARMGGRLEFVNERARRFFGLDGQTPDLVNMARQVRPSETFWELFATEGTANISIGMSGQQLEATSLRIPGDEHSQSKMVVLLRETGRLPELAVADERTAQAMGVIAEISRAIASSLDLNATFDAVLANVGRLLQYDVAEINLWDTTAQVLRPARYAGNREYERLIQREADFAYRAEEGFSGWLASHRAPLRIGDVQSYKLVRPKVQRADFPFRSFLGVPLLVGPQLVGTLELISYQTDMYKPSDEVLLSAIAGQAAIAIQNAQLYAEQQRRVAELSGVAEITRAIETSDNPRQLYGRLTADIARLMGVEMVGFLLYDEGQHALVAQPPFRGVPDWVLETYRISVEAGSPIEAIWREAPYWFTNDVQTDPVVEAIGLKALSETAGVHTTLIAPIAIAGRRVGIVQASNRADKTPFDEGDARLLTIFAAQTAAILENARLVREAQERAEQAEGLRQIAVTAAGTDLDSILRRAMEQTAQLLKFDAGVISLLDEARGELVPHPASIYGGQSDIAEARIRSNDPLFALSVTRTRRPFLTNRALRDRRIAGVYRPVVERYQMNSVMDVPLIVGEQCLGEMIVASQRENAFTRADLRLLATVAAQLASSIERSRLYAATDQSLQRRVDQLTALTRVSRELNQTLDRERVLRLVHSEVITATRADGGTITLLNLDPNRTNVIALRIGGAPSIGLNPLEMDAALSGKPIRLNQVEPAAEAEGVRAVMVVPIVEQDTVVGLINLHSSRSAGFDDTALETAMALAAQASIAVGNAQRYEEQLKRNELLRRRADQMGQLFEISRTVRSDRPLAENLESIAFGLQEASGFNIVVINLIEPHSQTLKAVAAVGLPLSQMDQLQATAQPWENVRRVLHSDFRISQSYLLPHERAAELVQSIVTLEMPAPPRLPAGVSNGWDPEDMFVSPIIGSGAETLGLISLDDPRSGLRPDRATVELIEIFSNQAALAVENARLFEAAQRRSARLLALHHVIERAAGLIDRNKLSQVMAEALIAEMGFDLCVVALMEGSRFVMRGHAGAIRAEVDFEAVLSRQNPLAYIIAEGEPLLALNVKGSEWAADPLVLALEVSSFLCAPIITQGRTIGALFVGSRKSPSPLVDEDVELFIILSNQIGAALESFRLESDIRRRAAQLGALADASRTITATLRTDDVVQAVMSNLHSVVNYDSVTLWLRAGEELRIVAAQGFENDAERLGLTVNIADSALFAEMSQTGGAILVPDVRDDARFPGGEFLPTRTWLGAPLISKGRIIGALTLDRVEAHSYSALAPQLLTAFANQAAVALDNARLFEENEERSLELDARTQRLTRLNRVSDQLSRTLDVNTMYETLMREVMEALQAGQAAVFTIEDGAPAFVFHEPEGAASPAPLYQVLARVREALAPVVIEDVTQDTLVAEEREALAARGVKSLMALPLVAAGSLIAVLHIEETGQRRRFNLSEVELVQTLANQTATAVQNARLLVEVQTRAFELAQRNERLGFLNRLATAMSSTLDVDMILYQAAGQVVELFSADHSSVFVFDEAGQTGTVEAEHPYQGALGLTLALSTDALAHQVLAHHVVTVGDIAADPRLSESFRTPLVGLGFKSLLIAPFLSQGRVIGAFTLDSLAPRRFSSDDIELCQIIAAQIAAALANAQFARDLESRVSLRTKELQMERERVETLLQVTTELSSSLDLDRVLARALQLVTEAVNATQGSIFILDLQTDELMYRAALGSPKVLPPGGEPARFKRGEGLVGWVIKSRQAAVIHNLDLDPRWKKVPGQNVSHKSAIAVPIMWNEDVLGAILLYSPMYNAFDEDQLRLVSAAANQVGSATNNAELYRLIRDQAERLGNLLRAQQVETTKNRSILEGIADGVLVADAEGQVILFNAACERILGLQRDQVLGRAITEFVGIYGVAGRSLIEAITRWSLDPGSYRPGDAFSQRLELEDNRVISVTLAPVMTGDEYLGSVSLMRDITREVEVDRLKSEFVTNVSHELRTPITPIKGYADLLMKGMVGPLEPNQLKLVEIIKSNADRLKMLVDDILDISRVESGQLEMSKRALDLSEIVNEVVDILRTQITQENKPLNLVDNVSSSLPSVWGDQERITQIIMNLADNAFSYTPEGGTVSFDARLDEARREVVLEVSDTGVGIPEEHRARLFDRFFRGENALVMATAGTGLGLSIARQLIEMQGGRIWLARTEEGRGTTFAIALPVAVTDTVKETA